MELQRRDELLAPEAPADEAVLLACLDLPGIVAGEDLRQAFQTSAVRWHPEFWQDAPEDQRLKAREALLLCWQSYYTLSDPRRLQEWQEKLDCWRKIHLPAHMRSAWTYKIGKKMDGKHPHGCDGDPQRLVPPYSPLSVPGASYPTNQTDMTSALLIKLFHGLWLTLPSLHTEWSWRLPQISLADEADLMKEVAEWKHYTSLDDVLSTMPAHEATPPQCAIDCGQHNLGEPNPSIEFQQQPESQKSFLLLEDATEPIFPPMKIQFAPIIPLTDDFIHSDT
eukprot:EG_transcript_12040